VITGLCGIGLLEYRTENNAFKLWIPDNSEFLKNYNFLQEKFPPDTRFNNIIVAGENVLTPAVIKLVRFSFPDSNVEGGTTPTGRTTTGGRE
jgi:hypothetical protein